MVNKWDVYYCSFDPAQGCEQRGFRPVLVISNNAVNHNIPVSTVLPFSSVKQDMRIYPTEVLISAGKSGLDKDSVVMLQQIRTVSHKRLVRRVSQISDIITQKQILEAIRAYFEY